MLNMDFCFCFRNLRTEISKYPIKTSNINYSNLLALQLLKKKKKNPNILISFKAPSLYSKDKITPKWPPLCLSDLKTHNLSLSSSFTSSTFFNHSKLSQNHSKTRRRRRRKRKCSSVPPTYLFLGLFFSFDFSETKSEKMTNTFFPQ